MKKYGLEPPLKRKYIFPEKSKRKVEKLSAGDFFAPVAMANGTCKWKLKYHD